MRIVRPEALLSLFILFNHDPLPGQFVTRKTRLPVAEGHGQVAVAAVLSPWRLI